MFIIEKNNKLYVVFPSEYEAEAYLECFCELLGAIPCCYGAYMNAYEIS